MKMTKSNKERQELHRQRKKLGLKKIEDRWAKPEQHQAILTAVDKIIKEGVK